MSLVIKATVVIIIACVPERTHDEGVENHFTRVQQIADGHLSAKRSRHRWTLLHVEQSHDWPSNASRQCRVDNSGGLHLRRLHLKRVQCLYTEASKQTINQSV